MKTVVETRYFCEACGGKFSQAKDALECESKPITQDKGAIVGSIVKILSGAGAGENARVERLFVCSPDYGPQVYTHTRSLQVECIESFGHRHLNFDAYEVVK